MTELTALIEQFANFQSYKYCILESLMKGKFDEFDEPWPNHQTKIIQYLKF